MRAYSMLASVQVSADAGTLTFPLLTDAGGTPVRLAEVEPWVWQDSEGRTPRGGAGRRVRRG